MKGILLLVAAAFACTANAEIYKCTGTDGKVNFTDSPCAATTKAETINIPPPPETPLDKIKRELEESRVAHEEWRKNFDAEQRERTRAAISKYVNREGRKGLRLGMTSTEVLKLDDWRSPDDVNSTQSVSGRREQWVYRDDYNNEASRMYLYFQDGILVTVQD